MKSPISQSATMPGMQIDSRLPLVKWGIVFSLLLFHVLVVIFFHQRYGLAILSFAILPVIAAGWLFGFGGGLISSMVIIIVDALLLSIIGEPANIQPFIPAILVLFLIGVFSGSARNLFKKRLDQGTELKKRLQESEAISR